MSCRLLIAIVTFAALSCSLVAQEAPEKEAPKNPEKKATKTAEALIERGLGVIVSMQEGKSKGEWPYEGVYSWGRDRKTKQKIIPIGYRIGGTSIAALALIELPGYAEDKERKAAVGRALGFVLKGLKEDLMEAGLNRRGYDVRGWGHAYALQFLLRLESKQAVPNGKTNRVKAAVKKLVKTIQKMAIPEAGGWNYSMRAGYQNPRNEASPFMTGPTLQALFEAKSMGHKVDSSIIEEAIAAIERGRTKSGGFVYSVNARRAKKTQKLDEDKLSFMDQKPGSMARMCVSEATLALCGRGNVERIRDAVSTFFTHWKELKVRKRKNGTHDKNHYGVAPYYFMYAHYYVAQAIEQLPEAERPEARQKLLDILAKEEEPNGGWNDRVFDRSRNYGTAMAVMALGMKDIKPFAKCDLGKPKSKKKSF